MEVFIKDSKEDLIKHNVGDNYCVIVYVYSGPTYASNNQVKYIYKTIEDFEDKFKPEDINSGLGINLELWIFD